MSRSKRIEHIREILDGQPNKIIVQKNTRIQPDSRL
jgi:hypothetical protein